MHQVDYSHLLKDHRTIHYYNICDHNLINDSVLVYHNIDAIDFTLINNVISNNNNVILLLHNIDNISELSVLENPNIIIICHKLRHYQQLLSYKSDDTLFLDYTDLDIHKRVILLLRDKKRVEHYDHNLKPNLKLLKIFPAIDAMTPHAIDNYVKMNQTPILRPIRAGKIGCAFSHLSLWKELLLNLYPCLMILEDDVIPNQKYNESITNILSELPVTFDLLFLFISSKYYRNDNTVQLNQKSYINKAYYTEDISAYIISRKGASTLLQNIKSIGEPLEMMINKEIERDNLEAYIARDRLFDNIGQKTATQENILESNTYDSQIYDPPKST